MARRFHFSTSCPNAIKPSRTTPRGSPMTRMGPSNLNWGACRRRSSAAALSRHPGSIAREVIVSSDPSHGLDGNPQHHGSRFPKCQCKSNGISSGQRLMKVQEHEVKPAGPQFDPSLRWDLYTLHLPHPHHIPLKEALMDLHGTGCRSFAPKESIRNGPVVHDFQVDGG